MRSRAVCVLIGLFAIYQVFFPLAQGNQVSLIYFLAAVLPLTLLCYRSGLRLRRKTAKSEEHERSPRSTRSTRCRPAIRRPWTGCLPRSRWLPVCTRYFPSNSQTAEEVSTSSSAGREPPRWSTSSSGRSCCCWCSKPAVAAPDWRCRSCVCSRWPTPTTADTCRKARRSRTPAWTGARSSARRSFRRPACTASRSTWRPPTSCCSPSTARCWTPRAPASSSSTCRWRHSGGPGPRPAGPSHWPGSCSAPFRARVRRPRSAWAR